MQGHFRYFDRDKVIWRFAKYSNKVYIIKHHANKSTSNIIIDKSRTYVKNNACTLYEHSGQKVTANVR